ncbi:hypothetical protein MPH_02629 [Macrophomina phaseolina MS6]|uniref:Uncharacterized protein n=1 Tax=Macrophomina phaseolina (strain MS6) TaxID=1126212 RepID=K2STQ4_MACPH|nr:hypothetical protein MPH_02629 [Macrophomina phaseolina MS6]
MPNLESTDFTSSPFSNWVLESELFLFDPSASESIPETPETRQLHEAYDSVLGFTNADGQLSLPDLGYWKTELVARDLQNIDTSSSSDTDNGVMLPTPPRSEKVALSSANDLKRPWAKFKLEKQFGEEFGYGRKRARSDKKSRTCWLPGENDDAADDQPPAGYFEKIKTEKENAELEREGTDDDDSDGIADLDVSNDDNSEGDGDDEGGDAEDSSENEVARKSRRSPVRHPQPRLKTEPQPCESRMPRQGSAQPTLILKSTSPNSSRGKMARDSNSSKVAQLCRGLNTARAESMWDQAEIAANQLVSLTQWSDADTFLIAKVAFRVAPRSGVEDSFELWLQAAVAEQFYLKYEYFRQNLNGMITRLFTDHEDLAEMVYERKLRALRDKRIEVIEISDDEDKSEEKKGEEEEEAEEERKPEIIDLDDDDSSSPRHSWTNKDTKSEPASQ